jgi:hypothetical protein
VPLGAIADQPFSADEVNTQNPTPNVHCLMPDEDDTHLSGIERTFPSRATRLLLRS